MCIVHGQHISSGNCNFSSVRWPHITNSYSVARVEPYLLCNNSVFFILSIWGRGGRSDLLNDLTNAHLFSWSLFQSSEEIIPVNYLVLLKTFIECLLIY